MLLVFAVSSCRTSTEDQLFAAWTFQDQRQDENGRLSELLAHESPQVRLQAARAMGSLRSAAYAAPLGTALANDPSSWVRHAATFALGQLKGRDHGDAILPALKDKELSLRSLGAAALGKTGSPRHLSELVPLLEDPAAVVRGAAALAILGIAGDRYRGQALRPGIDPLEWPLITAALEAQVRREVSPKARWQETYALAHLAIPSSREILMEIAKTPGRKQDPDTRWARVFAIHGLGTLPAGEDLEDLLSDLMGDADPAIIIAAMRCAATPRRLTGDKQPILGSKLCSLVIDSPSVAVRQTAAELLREFPELEIHESVLHSRQDSTNVRAALFETEVLLTPTQFFEELIFTTLGCEDHWWLISVLARHLYRAPENMRKDLASDLQVAVDDVRVKLALLENLHQIPGKLGADICADLAKAKDSAVREALADSIEKFAEDHPEKPRLIAVLLDAFQDSPGSTLAEARKGMVRVIAKGEPDSPATISFLESALDDPDYIVRKQAATQLAHLGHAQLAAQLTPPKDLFTPYPGRELPASFMSSRPQLTLHTTKGKIVISLFPQLAPIHCFNLMTIAMRGDYDGREFHRVVPNFVIQGGSTRPDGYANRAWNGKTIRDEINPLQFTSGVVGMPKSSDPDTGGDQIFITLLPTPHLDGKYTAFGKVTEGMDVVESIEVGAIIQKTDVLLR